MRTKREFANAPDAIARARRFVAGEIAGVRADVADEIAIMVSELATNCVRHTGTDFVVDVERTDRQVRVEVTDTGSGVPVVRSPGVHEPSGRGLRIVRELADSFGVEHNSGAPGKTVWFVVGLDEVDAPPRGRVGRVGRGEPAGRPKSATGAPVRRPPGRRGGSSAGPAPRAESRVRTRP